MPQQAGVSHVALTVTDVTRSADWYRQLLDAQTAFEGEDQYGKITVLVSGSLMIGFRQHATTGAGDRFDPARVGLDHVGFACGSAGDLEKWVARLEELGATHSGIVEDPFGLHLSAKDPDDIAIEFYVGPQG